MRDEEENAAPVLYLDTLLRCCTWISENFPDAKKRKHLNGEKLNEYEVQLTTVSSRPFRSCLACSLLSSCNLQTCSSLTGVFVGVRRPRLGCVCQRYVSSCSWRLFSCSAVFSFSCSTRSLSCSNIICWFRLHTRQKRHQAPWRFHRWLSMLRLTPAAPWSASPWRPAHLEGCWSASGGSLGETGSASLQHPESTRSVTLKPAMLLIKTAQN